MKAKCSWCEKTFEICTGHFNRATARSGTIYCSRTCAGLGRRKWRRKEEKVEQKRLYDKARRERLGETLLKQKREAHKRNYDPVKAAAYRKARMQWHVKYCQRPEYKEWKKGYDRHYRARKMFGEFSEAFLILMDIENEVAARITKHEARQENGLINKKQLRRREYEKLISQHA